MKANLVWANPTSGRGRGSKILAETLDYLDKQRVRYHVIATSSLDSAIQEFQEKSLSDFERLFIIGGDGLVHHALNELAPRAAADIPMGIVPAGTGNDFARTSFQKMSDLAKIVEAIGSNSYRHIDVIKVDLLDSSRYFGQVLSSGFDSYVNAKANRLRYSPGSVKYVLALFLELPAFKPLHYELIIDGKVAEISAMMVVLLVIVSDGFSFILDLVTVLVSTLLRTPSLLVLISSIATANS